MTGAGERAVRLLLGRMRAAMEEYSMISPGDSVAVAVSGGKDSVALLYALAIMRRFYPAPYTLHAVTIDPGFGGVAGDYSALEELCRELVVPYTVKRTAIGRIVFDTRREKNPCSLCARMRRGALHDAALELGCGKVALGHHMDDAAETFIMNLFGTGQLGAFPPVHYMSRKGVTLIRPMVLAREYEVAAVARAADLPLAGAKCPADGATAREDAKTLLRELERRYPRVREKIIGALRRSRFGGW